MKSFSKSAAVLAGGLVFAGTASGATFFEDFESIDRSGAGSDNSNVTGDTGNWATGDVGTYGTGAVWDGSDHTTDLGGAGGGAFGHSIGVANPAISNAVVIGAGETQYNFSAWLASYYGDGDTTLIQVQFYSDAAGNTQLGSLIDLADGSAEGSSTTPSGAWDVDNWSNYTASGSVAAGAQSFRILYTGVGNDNYADNISFETVVPEPGSLALLGLGGLALLRRRR